MPSIQIKNVPPDVHQKLRERAAKQGRSLQEYLLGEITRQARQETNEELFARIERRAGGRANFTPEDVLDAIHAGREGR